MIWVDREATKIKERNLPLEWVDDMKTPSGRIHVGSLRGVVIHDLAYKGLLDSGIKAKFTYVFNDLDQMDGIPSYLEYAKWEKYAGMPLCNIPSPEPGSESFARCYANEFISVFESINCHPEIIWSSELYKSGKMNAVIKEGLDAAVKIREIYKRIAKADRPSDWYPFQVICENCGKVGTTYVYDWDGKEVSYRCRKEMVAWAQGCGYEGKVSPYDGNGKFHWRVDWPAHWKVIGVTVEGAGKDHMSAGGSYEMAAAFCKEVFNIAAPYPLPYEWFTVGGRKMASSKGIGASAKEISGILPPEVFRFLIVRTPIGTALDFNPYGETILNLFDDYDRCLTAYFDKLENKIPEGKPGEVLHDFARIAHLSEVRSLPEQRLFLPRFRTVVNLLQTKANPADFFAEQKKSALTQAEQDILQERIKYAQIYLDKYMDEEERIKLTEDIPTITLTENQSKFLSELNLVLSKNQTAGREEIQKFVFDILKANNLQAKEVFKAFYQLLIGKDFGPKAADLILEFGPAKVLERLNAFQSKSTHESTNAKQHIYPNLNENDIFTIDPAVSTKFPSIIVGVALIKGVTIKKETDELTQLTDNFLVSQQHLTNEIISSFPEIISYRKMYKQMGIDWHSRRPSPEALLRRIALKKELYRINTCVDAYNYVVMKNHVSAGAFDADKISFPTVLRFPNPGDEILLLGDKAPTLYKSTEVAYFDQKGGYNIDFNYRDAQRTAVTEHTKNILLNIDGIFDISRQQVEVTLKESIEQITKYCGGTVELAGIVTA